MTAVLQFGSTAPPRAGTMEPSNTDVLRSVKTDGSIVRPRSSGGGYGAYVFDLIEQGNIRGRQFGSTAPLRRGLWSRRIGLIRCA